MGAVTLRLNILETDAEWILICESQLGRAEVHVPTPFAKDELVGALHAMQLANVRSTSKPLTRKSGSPELVARAFGQQLGEILFTGKAGVLLDRCRTQARQRDVPMRLLLETNGRYAGRIPWEFVADPMRTDDYLALRVALARSLAIAEPASPLKVRPPLKVLGIRSRPRDLPELDYRQEQQKIAAAFDQASSDLVEVTWLEGDRWKDINQAVSSGTWHVLHFVGHGGFNDEIDAGYLELTGDDGNSLAVSSVDIGRAISRSRQLRLIVLNACESASAGSSDVFASTAAKLMLEGIPAVVAMQYEITDEAALVFAGEFYEAIARNVAVDEAVSRARESVRVNLRSLEWATPVLFLASEEATLFDVAPTPETRQPRPEPEVPRAQVARPQTPRPQTPRAQNPRPQSPPRQRQPGGQTAPPPHAPAPAAPPPTSDWLAKVGLPGDGGVGERLAAAYRNWTGTPPRQTSPPWTTAAVQQLPPDQIRTVFAVGPNGLVAFATAAGEVGIWSVKTQARTVSCALPAGHSAYRMAWHPGGRHVASANDDGTVVVWDVVQEAGVRTLRPDGGRITGLAFSRGGRWLAIACYDRTLHVLDSRGETVRRLRLTAVSAGPSTWMGGARPLGPVSFFDDDRSLVVASNDRRVCRFDVAGRLVTSWPHEVADVTALSVHGQLLATCAADGRLRVWDWAGALLRRHEIPPADHLAWSDTGRLVVASRDGSVRLWSKDGSQAASTTLDGPPVGVGFSGPVVVLGVPAAPLQLWSA